MMFTIEQVKDAHSKVKSGADFPVYIQALAQLGVRTYEAYVSDGQTVYKNAEGISVASDKKYEVMPIAEESKSEEFIAYLKAHQAGETDYPTFCLHCSITGIEKWEVSIIDMTCTYFDKAGNEILVENIPMA